MNSSGVVGSSVMLEYGLVVDHAGGLAVGGHAVGLAVIGLFGGELDLLLHSVEGTVGNEVVAQFGLINGGDHHDVAPVAALQSGERVVSVVGVGLRGDLDVRVQLVEVGDIGLPVLARVGIQAHIGTPVVELDAGRDVFAGLAEFDLVVGHIGLAAGTAVGAAACREADQAEGRNACCDNLLEVHPSCPS